MKKKLILVASPPACGKTYVSKLIAKSVGHVVYLDKDDLCALIRASFAVAGEEVNMDGEFYINNLRPAEYDTILHIAFSALRFADTVLLNAPFGKEVRDAETMRRLKARANALDAELLLIWVSTPTDVCYERMKKRNSDRDTLKLANWEDYIRKINYTPPHELTELGAVDRLILFDNKDDTSAELSLKKTLNIILGD
jgi:predicted kinase